jgi:hypothetical protein
MEPSEFEKLLREIASNTAGNSTGRGVDFNQILEALKARRIEADSNGASYAYLSSIDADIDSIEESLQKQFDILSQINDAAKSDPNIARDLTEDELREIYRYIRDLSVDSRERDRLAGEILRLEREIDKVRNSTSKTQEEKDREEESLTRDIDEAAEKIDKITDRIDQDWSDFKAKHSDEISDLVDEYRLPSHEDVRREIADIEEIYARIEEKELPEINNLVRQNTILVDDNREGVRKVALMWDAVTHAVDVAKMQLKEGADMWLRYNERAMADVKRLGILSKEGARQYMESLMADAKVLMRDFGMNADQAMKLQDMYTAATGRSMLLTREQMRDVAASSRLMGEETVMNAIRIMDSMGSTSERAMELLGLNYIRAANSGIDTTKASDTFVKNMSLANSLNFRNGVDGISKMSILSEKVKLNLQNVASVADKFNTIEGAIENSARMQVLGGVGATMFGNPMDMLYKSLADPEALFKDMVDLFSQQATFDRRTGEAVLSPYQQALIREQEKILGIAPGEGVQSAKQQARLRNIEEEWRRTSLSTYRAVTSEEERDLIKNRAHFDRAIGEWRINYRDEFGEKRDVSFSQLTPGVMRSIMRDNVEPVEDIRDNVRKIASELVPLRERWQSMLDQKDTAIAEMIDPAMNLADKVTNVVNQSSFWKEFITGGTLLTTGVAIGAGAGIAGVTKFARTSIIEPYIEKLKLDIANKYFGGNASAAPQGPTGNVRGTGGPTPGMRPSPPTGGRSWFSGIKVPRAVSVGGKFIGGLGLALSIKDAVGQFAELGRIGEQGRYREQ